MISLYCKRFTAFTAYKFYKHQVRVKLCWELRFPCRDADYVRIPELVLFFFSFLFSRFWFCTNRKWYRSLFFPQLGLSHGEMSLQGKAKKTRKFATVKRMLNPNDIRLKQKKKDEEGKEKAVRRVSVPTWISLHTEC